MGYPTDYAIHEEMVKHVVGELGGEAEQYTLEAVELSDHGGGEWTGVCQVYSNSQEKYVGVARANGYDEVIYSASFEEEASV